MKCPGTQWIKVAEQKPPYGVPVLIYNPETPEMIYSFQVAWLEEDGSWYSPHHAVSWPNYTTAWWVRLDTISRKT
jgi:hypothetical protein